MNLGEQFARLFFENELFILTYKLGAFELCQFNGQKLTVRRPPANQLRVDHENIIVFASVDIKSQRLVTSSQDKTVKVWNLSA
jgi:WD40 repeat protein